MERSIPRRHLMLSLRADLLQADPDRLHAFARHTETLGLTVTTLARERERDPAAWERVYTCHNECRRRQPPVELRTEPIPPDAWRQGFVDGEQAWPDGYFIARPAESDTYVGVCAFVPMADRPDTLVCGFTGTLPEWSGRGLARALKAHAMLAARAQGFAAVETRILQINRPIRRVNETLGFTLLRRQWHTFPIPVSALSKND
jgi:GNAT superfamily N-acetyltransferase